MNPETKKPLSLKNDYVFRSVLGKEGCEEELADFLKSALGLPKLPKGSDGTYCSDN